MAHQLSVDYTTTEGAGSGTTTTTDAQAERLSSVIEACRRCETVQEILLQPALAGLYDGLDDAAADDLLAQFRKGYESSGSSVVPST